MTNKEIVNKFTDFTIAHNIPFDDFLQAMSESIREEANTETHAGVKTLLHSVADSLSAASFEYYASTK